MRRREFVALLAGTTMAWPLPGRAQRMPVVGYLTSGSPESDALRVTAFEQGLTGTGYVKGENLAIEYRWADGQYNRLPMLASELVSRRVAVIAAIGGSALAAKAATTTIPIVFAVAGDPVEMGLVTSLNRPSGNATGVTSLNEELGPKLLELLHELVPKMSIVAALINPTNSALAEIQSRDLLAAASALRLRLHVLYARSERDFEAVFASLVSLGAGALVIATDPLFTSRSEQLAALSGRHAVPAIYQYREFPAFGGLASYGGSLMDSYRRVGAYTAQILKGAKPGDLPVQQATQVDLVINLKTAKTLGLPVSPSLLARADEVIE